MLYCLTKGFASASEAIRNAMATSWSLGQSDLGFFSECNTKEDFEQKCMEYAEQPNAYAHVHVELDDNLGLDYVFSYRTVTGKNELSIIVSDTEVEACYAVCSQHVSSMSSAVQAFEGSGWSLMWDDQNEITEAFTMSQIGDIVNDERELAKLLDRADKLGYQF